MSINMQGLYSVLEEEEENYDETKSHSAQNKLSNDFSSINWSLDGEVVSTQLVFFYITEFEELDVKETSYHLQSESKICEFTKKELISMYIEKEYSFVLTSKNEVLLIGNFAGMLNIADDSKPEFLKLPFLHRMKIIKISCAFSSALFLSESGKVYSWGRDTDELGLLGSKGVYQQTSPALLDTLANCKIVDVSLGSNHAVAIDESGRLFTWGKGEQGELGHGFELIQSDVPLQVLWVDDLKIVKAAATSCSTIFLSEDNVLGLFIGNTKLLLQSIIDYVPSEIFTGLVSDNKLMILTHDFHLFEICKYSFI